MTGDTTNPPAIEGFRYVGFEPKSEEFRAEAQDLLRKEIRALRLNRIGAFASIALMVGSMFAVMRDWSGIIAVIGTIAMVATAIFLTRLSGGSAVVSYYRDLENSSGHWVYEPISEGGEGEMNFAESELDDDGKLRIPAAPK